MDWRLEVVVVPVSDVDRAKEFYAETLGFEVDHDSEVGPGHRVVQLTPPGSGCSVVLQGGGGAKMQPGSLQGLQLCVSDLRAAQAQLSDRGLDVGDVQVFDQGSPRPAREGETLEMTGFLFFSDPDGNGWGIQQMPRRGG
jgi:catechol 2,3-dioxygenase-like lactoylglutathione lyase family enzyme